MCTYLGPNWYARWMARKLPTMFRRLGLAVLASLLLARVILAGPFSDLVVFGDSLSDIGNIAQAPFINTPGPYYWNGRFSNGPVYAESLATGLGLPTLKRSTSTGGGDYAYGGAKTTGTGFPDSLVVRDIDDQVSQFLGARSANASTLYVVLAGANDLIGGQTNMSVPIGSLQTSINRLVTAGARELLVINLPPLGNTPRYNGSTASREQYNVRAQQYNAALATMLNGLQTGNAALSIHQLDLFSLFNRVLAEPTLFDLVNVTSSAAPGLAPGDTSYNTTQIVPNPNEYLFWDDLHPTAAVHAMLAQRALDLFRLPGDFNGDNEVDAADYVVWRNNRGAPYLPYDYEVWRSHSGQIADGQIAAGQAVVPEPTAIAVLFSAGLAAVLVWRRNRTRFGRFWL
jgi:thermolabile hemolysin